MSAHNVVATNPPIHCVKSCGCDGTEWPNECGMCGLPKEQEPGTGHPMSVENRMTQLQSENEDLRARLAAIEERLAERA